MTTEKKKSAPRENQCTGTDNSGGTWYTHRCERDAKGTDSKGNKLCGIHLAGRRRAEANETAWKEKEAQNRLIEDAGKLRAGELLKLLGIDENDRPFARLAIEPAYSTITRQFTGGVTLSADLTDKLLLLLREIVKRPA